MNSKKKLSNEKKNHNLQSFYIKKDFPSLCKYFTTLLFSQNLSFVHFFFNHRKFESFVINYKFMKTKYCTSNKTVQCT